MNNETNGQLIQQGFKNIIANVGWSGNKIHAIRVSTLRPICDNGAGIGARFPNRMKKVEATAENVTCEKCLTHLK